METSYQLNVLDEQLSVMIYELESQAEKDVLFIHGAGMASMERYKYLAEFLNKLKYRSILFNFSGHGSSSGVLHQSSLKRRVQEANEIIRSYVVKPKLSIIASSMGGYVAIKLLEKYQIENLVLFCPAVYSTKAFDLLFGDDFSREIRSENSWLNTDAFQIIKGYKGRLLIIIGENDDIIPSRIIDLLYENAVMSDYKKLLRISEAPHAIHSWLTNCIHESSLQKVKEQLLNCLTY